MLKKLLSPQPIWQENGLATIRILIGAFVVYHGMKVLMPDKMAEYVKWDTFKSNNIMPYIGKGAEFTAGAMLLPGLFTRVACLTIIGTFTYICFFVGTGKFWMDDQYPFLFALFGLLFFFTGPVKFSLDNMLFQKR
ncbi:MAG: DoxX family protein [Sphingobacteriales bacterium]|nr:DoxX family protein [Sphingobacteriales bacterium]